MSILESTLRSTRNYIVCIIIEFDGAQLNKRDIYTQLLNQYSNKNDVPCQMECAI